MARKKSAREVHLENENLKLRVRYNKLDEQLQASKKEAFTYYQEMQKYKNMLDRKSGSGSYILGDRSNTNPSGIKPPIPVEKSTIDFQSKSIFTDNISSILNGIAGMLGSDLSMNRDIFEIITHEPDSNDNISRKEIVINPEDKESIESSIKEISTIMNTSYTNQVFEPFTIIYDGVLSNVDSPLEARHMRFLLKNILSSIE
jgi:hypothetical protein